MKYLKGSLVLIYGAFFLPGFLIFLTALFNHKSTFFEGGNGSFKEDCSTDYIML